MYHHGHRNHHITNQIKELNLTLQEASENIYSLDRIVGHHREFGSRHRSPEQTGKMKSANDWKDLHQTVKDMASGQTRMADQLNQLSTAQENASGTMIAGNTNMQSSTFKLDDTLIRVAQRLEAAQESLQKTQVRGSRELSQTLQRALEKRQLEQATLSTESSTKFEVLKSDLERSKHELSQERSFRESLQQRLSENVKHSSTMDQTQARLKARVEELEAKLESSRRQLEERIEIGNEKFRLEKELDRIREELTASVPHTDLQNSQKRIEKLEQERTHLTEQISKLSRNEEEKSRQLISLVREAQTTGEQLRQTQECRDMLTTRESQLQSELKVAQAHSIDMESRADREILIGREKNSRWQEERQLSENKIEELHKRSSHLTKEISRTHNALLEQTQRCERANIQVDTLTRELEEVRGEAVSMATSVERLVETRGRETDQWRDDEAQLEVMTLKVHELEARVACGSKEEEKLEFELESVRAEVVRLQLEKRFQEERQSEAETVAERADMKIDNLTKELEACRVEIATFQGVRDKLTTAEQESQQLKYQLDQSTRQLSKVSTKLKKKLQQLQTERDNLSCRVKDEITSNEDTKAQCRRQADEVLRLNDALWRADDSAESLNRLLEAKVSAAQDSECSSRAGIPSPESDNHLVDVWSEKFKCFEGERDRLLRWTTSEVDALIGVSMETGIGMSALPQWNSSVPAGLDPGVGPLVPERWCADLRAKLAWMRDAVRTLRAGLAGSQRKMEAYQEAQKDRDIAEERLTRDLETIKQCISAENNEVGLIVHSSSHAPLPSTTVLANKAIEKTQKTQRKCRQAQQNLGILREDLLSLERPPHFLHPVECVIPQMMARADHMFEN